MAHAHGEEHRQERTLVQDAPARYPFSSLSHLLAPPGALRSWSRLPGKTIHRLVVSRGMQSMLLDGLALKMHEDAAATAGIVGAAGTARDHRGRRRGTGDTSIAEVGRS